MKIDSIVLDLVRKKVQKLIDEGSTKTYAVTTVCTDMDLDPKVIMKKLFPSSKKKEFKYDDIKTSEGSYVVLKKNPNKQYEVININNKDSIIIRDLDNNSELKVKEEEILPVVMETRMKENLNETNYNLSIDGLQTVDADTLSQILTLAGQADNGGAESVVPMDDALGGFEPTIPAELDGEGFEAAEIDNPEAPFGDAVDAVSDMDSGMDEFEEVGYDYNSDSAIEEDVLLDPKSDDETYNAHMNESEEMTEGEPLSEEDMGGEEMIEESDEEIIEEEAEEMIEESDDFDAEIAECLRLAGVELNEVSEEKATDGKKDLPQVLGKKTSFAKAEKDGFKPGENQRPDYKCVKTKDAMQPQEIKIKEMVSKERINSICETATRMYAKKDHSEWLALDRRYVEKLIKEGVSYTNASKMLLKAKAGK